jgi:hypothetical protein
MKKVYIVINETYDDEGSPEVICICKSKKIAENIIKDIGIYLKEADDFEKVQMKEFKKEFASKYENFPIEPQYPKTDLDTDPDWYVKYVKAKDIYADENRKYLYAEAEASSEYWYNNFKSSVNIDGEILSKIDYIEAKDLYIQEEDLITSWLY